ncbi:MAG: haloalkane dehalogenase [Bacteroidetes bacterium]|nr:MAG: haloalkane dehalogenase [Bacteroidota bacterium]
METNKKEISAAFPFESKYIDINGSKIHYIDEGEGNPILFLHGNPTSSYLWRNIIPYLQPIGRCIAPDLIGMGKSDKPDIKYGFQDTYDYLEAFIDSLGLKNITLVIHDWGSGLGFHYANTHRDNIKGIAFMEAMVKPLTWKGMPSASLRMAFRMMRTPGIGWLMISVANMFVKKLIPDMIVRKLSKEEIDYYEMPFPTIASRKSVRVWPIEVPLDGNPKHTYEIIKAYGEWLKESSIPKLFFYAHPGAIILKDTVEYIKSNFSNMKTVDIGKGLHFIQEDNPHQIGEEIAKWYNEI